MKQSEKKEWAIAILIGLIITAVCLWVSWVMVSAAIVVSAALD